jgi:hypothetical protein
MDWLIAIVLLAAGAVGMHECGHYATARILGLDPKLRWLGWHFCVEYQNPPEADWKYRLVSQMGFTWEIAFGAFLAFQPYSQNLRHVLQIYLVILLLHFAEYPWTSRYLSINDFNGLRSIPRPEPQSAEDDE